MASSATTAGGQSGTMSGGQSGGQTGTDDKTYNLTSVLYHALQGVENCELYGEDAQDDETRQFFDQACQQQREIAQQAKKLLHDCLMEELQGGGQSGRQQGSGSAFSFGSDDQSGQSSSGSSGQMGGSSSSM